MRLPGEVRVKICGLKTPGDVAAVARAGAAWSCRVSIRDADSIRAPVGARRRQRHGFVTLVPQPQGLC